MEGKGRQETGAGIWICCLEAEGRWGGRLQWKLPFILSAYTYRWFKGYAYQNWCKDQSNIADGSCHLIVWQRTLAGSCVNGPAEPGYKPFPVPFNHLQNRTILEAEMLRRVLFPTNLTDKSIDTSIVWHSKVTAKSLKILIHVLIFQPAVWALNYLFPERILSSSDSFHVTDAKCLGNIKEFL